MRDARENFENVDAVVIGISPDPPARQKKFDDKHSLGFTLLSDEDHSVAEAYGAWGEKTMYGKKVQGVIRSSFLLDGDGTVLEAWYRIKPEETAGKAIEVLREMT